MLSPKAQWKCAGTLQDDAKNETDDYQSKSTKNARKSTVDEMFEYCSQTAFVDSMGDRV
jgi:hypothetical protein